MNTNVYNKDSTTQNQDIDIDPQNRDIQQLSYHSELNSESKETVESMDKSENPNSKHNELTKMEEISSQSNEFEFARFEKLPLSSVEVSMPQIHETKLTSHHIYPISFVWNGKHYEVMRRYSEIEQLRKSLRLFLPFTFIIPVHKKQIIVNLLGEQQGGFPRGSDAGAE
jgi:hypothetical protein